jgi:hypothetical protein
VEASGVSLARRIAISRSRISIRSCTRRRRLGPSFALVSILTRLPLSFSAKASFDFRAFREGSGIAEVLWRGAVEWVRKGGADQARPDQSYLNSWLIDGSGNGAARERVSLRLGRLVGPHSAPGSIAITTCPTSGARLALGAAPEWKDSLADRGIESASCGSAPHRAALRRSRPPRWADQSPLPHPRICASISAVRTSRLMKRCARWTYVPG